MQPGGHHMAEAIKFEPDPEGMEMLKAERFDTGMCGVVAVPPYCLDPEPPAQQRPKHAIVHPGAPKGYWKLIPHLFRDDEYQVDWQCKCGTNNTFTKPVSELKKFPQFAVYCTHCNERLNVTFTMAETANEQV